MPSTVARTFASASSMALASIPRLRKRGMSFSYSTDVIPGERNETRDPSFSLRLPSRWIPARAAFGRLAGMTAELFDRLRIDRASRSARDDQRRAAEEELVDLVPGAVLGELLEIED